MKTLPYLILFFSFLSVKSAIASEKLDLQTHDSLIKKLESVVDQQNKNDSMFLETNLAYRLADLYAERARLLAADQEGQGEKIHEKQIKLDRESAIKILSRITDQLQPKEKGTALMQMAHLHTLQNQPEKALALYLQMQSSNKLYDEKTNAMVQTQLADAEFFKAEFDQAKKHYIKALVKQNPRKAYVMWRLAWCNYNQGRTKVAETELIDLLKKKDLFLNAAGQEDVSFQEDVSHDLALFMAKNGIDQESPKTLSKLSPQAAQKKNLIFLATELDRTAKKESALIVWKLVGAHDISFEDQLSRQIQMTKIEYDLGRKKNLLIELDRSIQLLKKSNCDSNAECVVAKQNLRHIITDWAKAEERLPSAELISAFAQFTQNFSDFEMSYWAAQAAFKRRQYKDAYQFHLQTIQILSSVSNKKAIESKMFEGSLIGSVEMAELTKDSNIRFEAYNRYLNLKPNGQQASQVKYQLAHWHYEKNDYQKASDEFRKLAADKKMPMDLREKAADLSLDSDVLVKDEKQIEAHSLELAMLLPSKKSEYLEIYRKSILNQSALILNQRQENLYAAELKKLNSVPESQFSQQSLKQVIKNKIELAFRLKDTDALIYNANKLLNLPKISQDEKQMGLGHLAWVYEIKLNFKQALKIYAQLKPATKSEQANYFFKLATLKELAHLNPTFEYESFLALSNAKEKREYAAYQIVLNAKNPSKAFAKYQIVLAKNHDLFNSAALFVFEKTRDQNFAMQILRRPAFAKSEQGLLVQHTLDIQKFIQLRKQIAATKFKDKSDLAVKRTLMRRNKQIKDIEFLANLSIKNKDTSMQIIYLTSAADQKRSLANEILTLPIPKNLAKEQKQAYQQQVQVMIQPYLEEATVIEQKVNKLWSLAIEKQTFQNLSSCFVKEKPGCQLAATEMKLLNASAKQTSLKSTPFENLSETRQKTLVEVDRIEERIQKNPFNTNDLAKLKALQSTLGHGPMVAYLDNRLSELNGGKFEN